MVPNGWEVKSLDSVSKVIDCKHRTPKYVKEGVPLVSPGTIKWGALDLITPTKRVSTEEYSSLMDHCTVNVGDLVLSRNQSVGVASFVESEEPFVLGQDTVLVKPTEADSRFLFYNLQSVETQRTIFKLAGGSTFSRINLGDIRKLKGIYPPLPEQRKIAKILSTWDKAISTTERLIDNSKQQKKALMQQLLTGKKRLLDDSGKPFKGEWEEVKVGSLITKHSEKTNRSGQYPVLTSSRKGIMFQSDYYNDRDVASEDNTGYNVVPRGFFTYRHMSDDLVFKFNINTICDKGIVSTLYPVFAAKENKVVPYFLQLLLNEGNEFKRFSLAQKQGGSRTYMYLSKLNDLKIYIPNINEQQKITSVLTNADKEIELLEQQLAGLKQEKKALMQQLLTGKRRVKVDDEAVA